MVRLSDLHPDEAANLIARAEAMERIEPAPWIEAKPLAESTVAIVTSAGLHRRGDRPFGVGALDYRLIPGDTGLDDLVVSHLSANFDRSALGADLNVVFPLDRLREMADAGEIAGVSQWHYSFMGAMPMPQLFEESGTEVGRLLAADGVDVALLVPI